MDKIEMDSNSVYINIYESYRYKLMIDLINTWEKRQSS